MNRVYSLLHNLKLDRQGTPPHLGTLNALPYFRVVPMHLAILAGAYSRGEPAPSRCSPSSRPEPDVLMHTIEHHVLRDVRAPGS